MLMKASDWLLATFLSTGYLFLGVSNSENRGRSLCENSTGH